MNYSKRFLKPIKSLRTIDEYCKAKKRLSVENFTSQDIEQIKNTTEGFFVVNNCKVPVKNGTLDLTQWINKHEKTIVLLTEEEKKANKKASQKAWRIRQRAKLLNPVEEPSHDMTAQNMPNIFRDYTEKHKASTCPKRLITAKRLSDIDAVKPKTHYGQYRAKSGANIPIQHLLRVAHWLVEEAGKNAGRTAETYRQYITRVTNEPKRYILLMNEVHKRKGLIV